VVLAIEENQTLRELFDIKKTMRFSRIPVYKDTIDNIRGYVLKYDILDKLANDEFDHTVKDLTREMTVVFEQYSIPAVLEIMMSKREHIALVVDEYGGMAGIVTMEDILETLLGLEIQDESDSEVDMQQLARKQWIARAKKLGLILPTDGNDRKQERPTFDNDSSPFLWMPVVERSRFSHTNDDDTEYKCSTISVAALASTP